MTRPSTRTVPLVMTQRAIRRRALAAERRAQGIHQVKWIPKVKEAVISLQNVWGVGA